MRLFFDCLVHLRLVSDSWETRQHREGEGELSPTRQLADKTIKTIKTIKAIQEKEKRAAMIAVLPCEVNWSPKKKKW